jgi:ribonucleotide monophosphatase NagD (HAD superfamily)
MPRIFTDIDDTILKDGQPVERVIDFIDEAAEEVVVLTNPLSPTARRPWPTSPPLVWSIRN